jgi:phage tail-like protein
VPRPHREDPFKALRFLVEIGGAATGFTEVSGLEAEAEVFEYRQGSDPLSSIRKLPGLLKYSNITLKRGYTTNRDLYDWWRTGVEGNVQRRNVAIVLLDDDGQELQRWLVYDAWITKYEGPTLDAKAKEVAIESVELAHEGFELA